MSLRNSTEQAYRLAKERYAEFGVDVESALKALAGISLSLHCWQGDDVGGFERTGAGLIGGGIQVTGRHPGKARTADELRTDLDLAYSLLPGKHRLNLHAMYGEFGGRPVNRDQVELEHYVGWVDWARQRGLGLDFNATCFSHPFADSGFTLSSHDGSIRVFWAEHVKRCRKIAADFGRLLQQPCLHNLWIPDGAKDIAVNRWEHRELLTASLDDIYAVRYDPAEMKDSIEGKLFGLGSEAFVVGSHDFYLGYALTRGLMICLDLGHYHPTESVSDKISSLLQFLPELLLHVSRGLRWDSDHVVLLDDQVTALASEVVRGQALDRVHIALDYFDASMNRVGAWVIGARATLKAFLSALLEPWQRIEEALRNHDNFAALALIEEAKSLPLGVVWDYYCEQHGVPTGEAWLNKIREHETRVTSARA